MSDKVDVGALAKLARLEVSADELAKLEQEIPHILEFVDTIKSVAELVTISPPEHHNVLRADTDPIDAGVYTEKILKAAPNREGDRVAVKQVVSRNKKS